MRIYASLRRDARFSRRICASWGREVNDRPTGQLEKLTCNNQTMPKVGVPHNSRVADTLEKKMGPCGGRKWVILAIVGRRRASVWSALEIFWMTQFWAWTWAAWVVHTHARRPVVGTPSPLGWWGWVA